VLGYQEGAEVDICSEIKGFGRELEVDIE